MAASGSLKDTFKLFATKANKNEATTKDMTRWCTDAKVFGKKCTSNNLDIAFSAVKTRGKTTITLSELGPLIDRLVPSYAEDRKLGLEEAKTDLTDKLRQTTPQTHGTTGFSKTGNVAGMTDASRYTGSHKERFDESGKGRGKVGRADSADGSGYVGAYKGAGTYDEKTKK